MGRQLRYDVTKLDKRYAWSHDFAYMIEFRKARFVTANGQYSSCVLDFDRSRKWFNEKFGWGQDVETRHSIIRDTKSKDEVNSLWSYSIKYNEYRIYVKDSAILNWFTISHPGNSDKN